MAIDIGFIERSKGETPSIEHLFRRIAKALDDAGLKTSFTTVPFGNGWADVLLNLIFFRPEKNDIYHITGDVHYVSLLLPPSRTVLTIHDLGILRVRKGLRRAILKKLFFDWPVRRLRYITVISETTKKELFEATGCPPEKIRVIANPAPREYVLDPKDFNQERPRILQVGTVQHKNLEGIAEAIKGLTCELRIVGYLTQDQTDLLRKLDINYSSTDDLDDAQMHAEYLGADIVVFCSMNEGFGMPVIEAQAVGRCVITSNISPMSDVAGSGAVLVDPSDTSQIREAVERVISDADLRTTLVAKGLENVERFSIDKIAVEYISLYGEMVDQFKD